RAIAATENLYTRVTWGALKFVYDPFGPGRPARAEHPNRAGGLNRMLLLGLAVLLYHLLNLGGDCLMGKIGLRNFIVEPGVGQSLISPRQCAQCRNQIRVANTAVATSAFSQGVAEA